MARARKPKPLFDARDRKIAFYSVIALSTIVSILALITYSFAGSPSPLDLFHYDNIKFSYTGTPANTYIYSNHFNAGLSGVSGTETNLTLRESGTLTLYPAEKDTGLPDNDERLEKDQGGYRLRLRPGEEARVSVAVSKNDDFNYNMGFALHDPANSTVAGSDGTLNATLVNRKSVDEYVVNAMYLPGADKLFSVIDTVRNKGTDEPRWNFPIRVVVDRCGADGRPVGAGHLKSYAYNGTIQVQSSGSFSLRSPVSKFSNIYCDRIKLVNAEGSLDVQHNGHDCSPADTITAFKGDDIIRSSLLGGRILAWGNADRLNFREKEFERPIIVIIKEGNFAILTGLLSSFLTIILARLITTVRKKSK